MPRYSIINDDAGYFNFIRHGYGGLVVTVDGEEIQNRCITADEEKGEALCHALDDAAEFYLDPDQNETAKEMMRGRVVVKLRNVL